MPLDAYGMTLAQARSWAELANLPAFRGEQLFSGLYRATGTPPALPKSFAELRTLPAPLRAELDAAGPLAPAVEDRRAVSRDRTTKALLRLHDGKLVECVSIPTKDRHTICVSSQVGCPVGCTFCASGLNGVERSLSAGEIVYQAAHHHVARPVTNVVFMGSGEPLFNYDNLLQAIRVMAEPTGLGLGRRRFTVSTSGVPDKIRQLAVDEPQVTLALSLHAPDDETRSTLVPLNRRWPLAEVLGAMDDYSRVVKRRMTFEYVLLADANMRPDQAHDLGELGRRFGAHINLIPYNPVHDTPHQRPTGEQVATFAKAVEAAGGVLTVRGQRGADIDAACGQLRRRAMGEAEKAADPAPAPAEPQP